MFHNAPKPETFIGSVGWEEDDDTTYYDLGDENNDGYTLVRVQLFEGRDPTQPLNQTRAQGTKIVCHISGGARIPPRNTRCYVQIPQGMMTTPGAGIITHTVEKTLDGRLRPDRVVMDYGDQHVIIKGKSVTIQSTDGIRYVSVGEPYDGGAQGINMGTKGAGMHVGDTVVGLYNSDGTEGASAKCVLQLNADGFTLSHNGGAGGSSLFRFNTGFSIQAPGTGFITPKILILGNPGAAAGGYKPLLPANPPGPTGINTGGAILFGSVS